VSGDRDRLGRLFTNLVSNAIAYTPAGGKVQITAQITSQNQIQIQVQDTGMGIPEAELSQIFERFYRYQPQKNSKSSSKSSNLYTSGSGLGLAIAKAIAESHQGQIKVESKVGQGTIFTVSFFNSNL
jgi:OmpR-family two-component system manganese-sensing sensor histidine kinase